MLNKYKGKETDRAAMIRAIGDPETWKRNIAARNKAYSSERHVLREPGIPKEWLDEEKPIRLPRAAVRVAKRKMAPLPRGEPILVYAAGPSSGVRRKASKKAKKPAKRSRKSSRKRKGKKFGKRKKAARRVRSTRR